VPGQQIMVVDSDEELRSSLVSSLRFESFCVAEAATGVEARLTAERDIPELTILELRLPDESGLELMQHLLRSTGTRVIVLTDLGREADRVIGLELGADDYVVKPHSTREVIARVRSVLRRPWPSAIWTSTSPPAPSRPTERRTTSHHASSTS